MNDVYERIACVTINRDSSLNQTVVPSKENKFLTHFADILILNQGVLTVHLPHEIK